MPLCIGAASAMVCIGQHYCPILGGLNGRGSSGPPADLRVDLGVDVGAGKDARGPAAEGEGAPERGRQAAGDRRAGKTVRRHEGCLRQ